ncbi:MAG: hypothetical protein WCD69_14420 [Xanthobacteraceae bacterium]
MTKTGSKLPQLKLVAIAEDEATNEFTAVIEFRDIDGHIRRIEGLDPACARSII